MVQEHRTIRPLDHLSLTCACGHAGEISGAALGALFDDEPSLEGLAMLVGRLVCSRCGRRAVRIFDDRNRLLFDQDRIVACERCDLPIPAARLNAMPDTKLCVTCAREAARPQPPPPAPQPPADQHTCPRCGAATAMYQNAEDKSWFIGCHTFPACRWSCDIP